MTEKENKRRSYFRNIWHKLIKNRLALLSMVILITETLAVIILPVVLKLDPYTSHSGKFGSGPEAGFIFGFDESGRDILARLLYGGRSSLLVGFASMSLASSIGIPLGVVAGFFRKVPEAIIMRFADMVSAFPSMIFMLVFVTVFGNSMISLIIIFGILGSPNFIRLMYGRVLSIREEEYIEAARAIGTGNLIIIGKYVLPNAIAPVFVQMAYSCSSSITFESGLSFLGIGIQPPKASWGNILYGARSITVLTSKPWIWAPAAVLFVITVLTINFLGDGLRKAINAKIT